MDDERVRQIMREELDCRDKRRRTLWHHIRTGLYTIVRAIERELGLQPPAKHK